MTRAHPRSFRILVPFAFIVAFGLFSCATCDRQEAKPSEPSDATPAPAVDPSSTDVVNESPDTSYAPPAGHEKPVKMKLSGTSNLYRINPTLWRGAQPEADGFKELEKQGIKTIVNLRSEHSDDDLVKGTKLTPLWFKMKASSPDDDVVFEFLKIALDPSRQPVFVHCKHGADRTGMAIASYRMVVDGWTNDAAYEEMTKGGFGFHSIWWDIKKFVKNFDAAAMRKRLTDAGVSVPTLAGQTR